MAGDADERANAKDSDIENDNATTPGLAEYELQNPSAITIDTRNAYIHTSDKALNIELPNHDEDVSLIALDVGGSLTKVVFFCQNPTGHGGQLRFAHFETEKLDECLAFVQKIIANRDISVVATGGGAVKYHGYITEVLGRAVAQEDEMESLIRGATFFMRNIPREVFSLGDDSAFCFQDVPHKTKAVYPCLLVNIGSGVSILKVNGPNSFERVGGSSLGGGTLWGLLSLLTPARTYDDMLGMALNGDYRNVDMLVSDIYGSDYSRVGLKSSTIASSFGKVFKNREQHYDAADISQSLLYAVSNNIGQLAYLHARCHDVEHIYFGGSYIRGHTPTIKALAYAIKFWSGGEKTAYFFRHEGYLGAAGAFLAHYGAARLEKGTPSPSPTRSASSDRT